MAAPPTSTGPRSSWLSHGTAGPGRPWGRAPSTDRPARVSRSNTAAASVAPATATRTPGTRRLPLSMPMTTSVAVPTARAAPFVSPASSAPANAPMRATGPSPSPPKPNRAGSWLTMTVTAMPFM